MKMIIGLGNPGKEYINTRHNVGFLAIDYYLKDKVSISCQGKFNAQICELHEQYTPSLASDGASHSLGRVGEVTKVFFVKPQGFMNLSGEVVRDIAAFYKLDATKDILVIHDDKDLPFGTLRDGRGSSAAGHNGVQNIIDEIGTKDFARVRVGVESRAEDSQVPTRDFVLQDFSGEEMKELDAKVWPETEVLIEKFIRQPGR